MPASASAAARATAARSAGRASRNAGIAAIASRGEAWSSQQLAERLGRWQQQGRDVALLVGGADGLDPDLRAKADLRVALSAMTLPHGLVRVFVVEQLYRAATLLQGRAYHK